jgi:hypothetical protein
MAGFAKRLMNIAMCLPPNACLAVISIVKEILNVRRRLASLAYTTPHAPLVAHLLRRLCMNTTAAHEGTAAAGQ